MLQHFALALKLYFSLENIHYGYVLSHQTGTLTGF